MENTIDSMLAQPAPGIITYGGIEVPVSYKRGTSDTLVVLFHGAVRRDTRPFPQYQGFLPVDAHQLAIADPTMLVHTTLDAAWYLGSSEQNVPATLSELIQEVSRKAGCKRRVYVGGSSGGFAALLYSWLDSSSLAVAAIPQTQLHTYHYRRPVQNFRSSCWPEARTVEEMARFAYSDLCVLYGERFDNTVIYVQSSGDREHVFNQMSPFVQSARASKENLILDVGFWGVLGHGGSTPPAVYVPWVQAALIAPTWGADDLLMTRHSMSARTDVRRRGRRAPPAAAQASFSVDDVRMADMLKRVQLDGGNHG